MANKKKDANKYTHGDYILLREYTKGHILDEIISSALYKEPENLACVLEQLLLSQDFVSDTANNMIDYMYFKKLDDMPLHINETNSFLKPIILWRLRIGK